MRRNIIIEFIKSEFEKEDYSLVTNVYKNSKQKLELVCPRGHTYFVSWNSWQQGRGCPICAGNRKHTIEFIKSEFEKEGWVCTSTKYINTYQKLGYICPEGHVGSISWNNWKQGNRCSSCFNIKRKYTIDFIKSEFKKVEWLCVSKEYIDSQSKLEYICPNGHHGTVTWANWQQGCRCPVCSGVKKHTIEFIKSEFEKEGWVCVSKDYTNSCSKLDYICPEGHHGSITWGHWQEGKSCLICAIINKSGPNHYNWKGGISFEPYCPIWKDKEYAESIKQRDGYKCMNPCCNLKNPDDLTRHHINYNKKDCRKKNIITACRSCNGAANFDRGFHKAWYQAIMYRKYGYTYDNTN